MRAYIDFEEDKIHTNDRAWVCKTPATTGYVDDGYDFVKMDPKKYYIEYPEQQMEELQKVRVNITGLDSEAVADIIILLRDEGYEAVLEMDPKYHWVPQPQVPYRPSPPFITNDKWYETPGILPTTIPYTNVIYGNFGSGNVPINLSSEDNE